MSGKSLVPHQQLGIEEDFDRALQKAPQEPDGSQTFKVGGSTINLDRQTLLRFQKELNAGDLSFLDKPIPYVRLTSDGLPGPKEWITPREFLRALRPSRDEKRPYPKIQEWLRDLSKRDSEETLVFGLYKNTAMQVRAGVLYAAIERYSHERSEDQWIRCDYIEDLSNRSRIDPGGFEVQVFQFLEEYSPEIRDSRQNRALPPKPRQAAISTQLDTPSSQLSPLALPEPRVPDKRVEDMVQALENLLREASQAPDGYARIPYRLLTPSANDPWHPILRLDLKSLEKLLDHVRREDFQSLDKQYSFDFEHPDRPSETPRYPITPLAFLKDLVLHPPSALESWIQELSQESYREFVLEDAEYSSMLINTAELSYYLHALRNSTLQQEPRIRCFCELKSPKDPSNPYVPADFELSWFLKAFPNPAQCPSPSGSIWSLSRQWVKTLEDLSREDCWFNTSDLQALASNHSPKSISSIAIDRKALLEQFGIYRNAPQQGIFSIECPCNLYPEDGSKPIPGTVGLFWLMAKNPDFLSNPSVDEPQDPNQEKLDRIAKGVQFADLPESSKEKQKAPEPAHSSSSSPLSVLDRFLQEPSNPQQPQRTISLKARVSNLVEKKSIWLPSSVRSKIINGSAGFIPPSRYHSDPVFKRTGGFRLVPEEDHPQINPETLPWNFTKLFADLESMLPSISQGTKIFASVDELLAAFGTSRETLISPIQSQEEKIQHDKLVSTLCCLTKAASKSCFDQLKEKLKEVKAGHGKIGFGQEPKPHIHIKVKEGITTIEICSDFELNDPQKDSGKLPFTAVLTLSGQHNNHFRLKPQSPNAFASSARLDMSFIGGGEALFNWHKSKFTAEDEALQSFIPPLEDPKPLSWRAWYDSWVNKASTTAIKWTDYLSHALFHQPHLAQDHKYRLALNTQIAALNAWLAKTLPHNNEPKDLKRNLLLAYRGQTLEPAYQTLFGPRCANSPLVDHVINALESLQDETLPIRIRNSTYLAHLRGALKSDDYKVNHPDFADIQALLRDLCWQRFTGNRMEQYESALIEFAIEGTPSKLFSSTIANAIALGNEELELCSPTLKKAPQDGAWQKFCNSFGLFSDPIGKSNVPELRSIHAVKRGDEIYPVLCLRHGTPTYQPTSLSLEEIVPEYRGFLDAAKERLKHVLYVNHQKMWPSWNPEEQAEYHRACTINALERDYPGTFHFLSLPLDGKIWSKSMLQSENTSDWKKEVVNALVNEQHGFKLPAGFLTEETKEEKKAYFIHLADKLHSLYFGDLDSIELSTKKRKIFLNIFYSYVKEVMKAHYKIELMASPCKDYKDRGNASTGIDESLMNLRLGLENENEELQKLYVRTLAPFTIKYEGILEKRLELLTDVLTHIGNLRQSDKEQIKRFNPKPGYSLYEDVNSLELPPSLHTDTASAIPLHQIEFPSFTEYLQTAIAKAGTVLLPTAVSNVLYGGPDPLRDSTTFAWNRNALEQALQYTVQIDGSQCSSIQDIAKALKMSPDTLFTKREGETDREFHSRMARLTWLSDRALMLCQEGLSEFLKNTSPYPLDQIVCKPASYPAFSSKREGASGWTNRIEQDYVLRFSQHEYVVRVVAVTNSRKKTKVTIYPR